MCSVHRQNYVTADSCPRWAHLFLLPPPFLPPPLPFPLPLPFFPPPFLPFPSLKTLSRERSPPRRFVSTGALTSGFTYSTPPLNFPSEACKPLSSVLSLGGGGFLLLLFGRKPASNSCINRITSSVYTKIWKENREKSIDFLKVHNFDVISVSSLWELWSPPFCLTGYLTALSKSYEMLMKKQIHYIMSPSTITLLWENRKKKHKRLSSEIPSLWDYPRWVDDSITEESLEKISVLQNLPPLYPIQLVLVSFSRSVPSI